MDVGLDFLLGYRPLQFPGEKTLARFLTGPGKVRQPVALGLDDVNLKIVADPRPLQFRHDAPRLA